ncbi:MAG: helix-turn-helix domain-containing protein [Pseudomonadales bacterium]|nr:helix-turn-helix domain-containing protein [Pseudomonadales bacterium]
MDRCLDVHVSNLRKKLGSHPTKGNRIRSVRGLGYALIH